MFYLFLMFQVLISSFNILLRFMFYYLIMLQVLLFITYLISTINKYITSIFRISYNYSK